MLGHKEKLNRRIILVANVIIFLIGFSQALLSYLSSTYFKDLSGTDNVGIFYFISYFVTFVIYLYCHYLVKWVGKSGLFLISNFFNILSLVVLLAIPHSQWGIFWFIIYLITMNVAWTALDIIVEAASVDKMSGRIRGAYLTIMNTGWLVAPFIATRLFSRFSFSGVFLVTALFTIVILVIGLAGFRGVSNVVEPTRKLSTALRKIIRRSDIMRAYYISFILDFFYSIMVIFTPLYLIQIGMSWNDIGIAFTIMLIPFVIVQYPAGVLADKKYGEKEMLIFSIILTGLSTGVLFFVSSTSVWVWGILLFATRIGAALIEVLRDSYFFKRIDGTNVDTIHFFRTAHTVAFMVGAIVSAIVLFILPIQYIFLVLAIIVLTGLYPVLRLKDSR